MVNKEIVIIIIIIIIIITIIIIETLARKRSQHTYQLWHARYGHVKVLFMFLLPIKFGKLRKYNG